MAAKRNTKNKDIFAKKVPQNPRYKHVRSVLDTGASVTNYMNKIEEIRKNYRFRKDEVFKRMKSSTFAQLVLQVAEVVNLELERQYLESSSTVKDENENVESNLNTAQQNGEVENERADLQNLLNGLGEVEQASSRNTSRDEDAMSKLSLHENEERESFQVPEVSSLPFLLLDVRGKEAYDKCHIIGALNYPSTMLTRSVNYLSKELLQFKNKEGKIIIFYDEDETIASYSATVLVERDIDNVIMLSGGMKVLNKKFPGCFLTGTIPSNCHSPPAERKAKKNKPPPQVSENVGVEWYTPDLLDKMQDLLDNVLIENDTSRMSSRSSSSKASTARSSASSASVKSTKSSAAVWK